MTQVVRVDGVSKRFRLYHERNQSLKAAVLRGGRAQFEDFWALRNISFEIAEGRTFGLVGTNGSGKSTLLKCIAKILRPDEGSVVTRGKVAALLELGSGFHPELSGRENVYLNGSILGLPRKELDARFDDIVGFAGLEKFIDSPVKNYSSGMYVRLGFSVAINVDPDILLVDEVLAVGDAAFQRKCEEKFASFRRDGRTVVVVSHDSGTMRNLCDEIAWLDEGVLKGTGSPGDMLDDYSEQDLAGREDAEVEQSSGAQRTGSGEVRLTKVELLDSTGRPATRFRTGEPLTFRQWYRADERIPRPVFGLNIESSDGIRVWAHNSKDGGRELDDLVGTGYVDLAVPALRLQEGDYTVTASIVDWPLLHRYDYVHRWIPFHVVHDTPRESGGFASLGGAWASVVRAEPGADVQA